MWAQRPIVEKRHRYAFYRPFTDSIASIICDLPTKLATAIMFNVPLYFMTNLRRSAGALFTYLVFLIATILTMSMFFRTVGSLSKTVEQSMVPSSMVILIFSAYTGYIIPAKDMVPWLAWLRRLNPIAFAYESLMINEVCETQILRNGAFLTRVVCQSEISLCAHYPIRSRLQRGRYERQDLRSDWSGAGSDRHQWLRLHR